MELVIELLALVGGVYAIVRLNRADLNRTEDNIKENMKELLKFKFEMHKTESQEYTKNQLKPTKNFLESLTNMLKNQNIKVPNAIKGNLDV